MLSFSSKQRYFLYRGICDMRKSFNGLGTLVNNEFNHSLMSKDIFIFINKRKNHIKLLMWDDTGFCIYHKRLAKGTFQFPVIEGMEKDLELHWRDVVLLLEGIDFKSVKLRKRFKATG